MAWELTSCSVVGWWFVSDGLALPSGGNDSRGNLLLANRAPSEARFGRVEGSVFAVGSFREDGKYHVQICCEYVFYMDCMYLLTVLRESFISEIVLNYLPALTRNYISLHSHIRQLEKGTPHNSSKSIYLYWQARPIPTPAKLSNYPERPSFCFGRTSLERSPSHPPHPYHHPHPSGRLPTVYPSASTSNTGETDANLDKDRLPRTHTQDLPPQRLGPHSSRLPHRDLTPSRPPSNAFTCASPLHRPSPDQTLLRTP